MFGFNSRNVKMGSKNLNLHLGARPTTNEGSYREREYYYVVPERVASTDKSSQCTTGGMLNFHSLVRSFFIRWFVRSFDGLLVRARKSMSVS